MRFLRMGGAAGAMTLWLARPAAAECFDCNYGLAIYMFLSLGVAALTALVGVVPVCPVEEGSACDNHDFSGHGTAGAGRHCR